VIDVKVVYGKQTFELQVDATQPLVRLKELIEKESGVPIPMQKLMFKGGDPSCNGF